MGNNQVDEALRLLALEECKLSIFDNFDKEEQEIYLHSLENKISRKIKTQALKQFLKDEYISYFRKLKREGQFDDRIPEIKELRQEEEDNEKLVQKSRYLFITINTKDNVPLNKLLELMKNLAKKVWIKKYLYVIEQRGETIDQLGKGFHSHILIDREGKKYSQILREFKTTIGDLVDVDNKSCFNIKPCKEEHLKNRQNYMISDKKDEEKRLKQDMDIIFRDKYTIKPYYGELFVELAPPEDITLTFP